MGFSYIVKGVLIADKPFKSEDVYKTIKKLKSDEYYSEEYDIKGIQDFSKNVIIKRINIGSRSNKVDVYDSKRTKVNVPTIIINEGVHYADILKYSILKNPFQISIMKDSKRYEGYDKENFWIFNDNKVLFNEDSYKQYTLVENLACIINDYFIPNNVKLNGAFVYIADPLEEDMSANAIVVIDNNIYICIIEDAVLQNLLKYVEEEEDDEEMDRKGEERNDNIIKRLEELSNCIIETSRPSPLPKITLPPLPPLPSLKKKDEDIDMSTLTSSLPSLKRKRDKEDLEEVEEKVVYTIKVTAIGFSEQKNKEEVHGPYIFSSINKTLMFIKTESKKFPQLKFIPSYDYDENEDTEEIFPPVDAENYYNNILEEEKSIDVIFTFKDKYMYYEIEKCTIDDPEQKLPY